MATGSRDGKKSAYRVPAQRATTLGVSAFLVAITWLVFGETVHHPSISFDDPLYVFENPQIISRFNFNRGSLGFQTFACGNWHPLTSISHMLDCQLFGQRVGATTSLMFYCTLSVWSCFFFCSRK